MSGPNSPPNLTGVFVKVAIIDAVLIGGGLALYLGTNELLWLIGAGLLMLIVLIALQAQAGVLEKRT